MRLLFDQNLSRRLIALLADEYPDSSHVALVGLDQADDREVWEYARDRGFVIVSKDGDFRQLAFLYGPPPKVVWLQVGNSPTSLILGLLRTARASLDDFVETPEEALFVVHLSGQR